MIARKYNPTTETYFTITSATVTAAQSPLSGTLVSYTVTDNGELDTNSTPGVIVDPVGLASTASTNGVGVPNTGVGPENSKAVLAIVVGVVGMIMIIAGVVSRKVYVAVRSKN